MDKEQFEKLTPDQKFPIINMYLDMMRQAISSRAGLIPVIAGLFATFLSIATFNEKLILLDNTVRIILTLLIILIPFSLWVHNASLKKYERKSREMLERWLDKIDVKSTTRDKIEAYLPDILIYIFFIISLIISYKILGCFWSVCS